MITRTFYVSNSTGYEAGSLYRAIEDLNANGNGEHGAKANEIVFDASLGESVYIHDDLPWIEKDVTFVNNTGADIVIEFDGNATYGFSFKTRNVSFEGENKIHIKSRSGKRGLYVKGNLTIANLPGDIDIYGDNYICGIEAYGNLTIGKFGGNIIVSSKKTSAAGVYVDGGALKIGAFSGKVRALVEQSKFLSSNYAYGFYAQDISIETFSGSIRARAYDYAYGVFPYDGDLTIGALSGNIEAQAEDNEACGLHAPKGSINAGSPLVVSGKILAQGPKACSIQSGKTVRIRVTETGVLSGVDLDDKIQYAVIAPRLPENSVALAQGATIVGKLQH